MTRIPHTPGIPAPTPSVKRVLVVIPTLNEARHIEAVLEALTRDLPLDAAVRFAVVDGGSTDGTVDIVRRLQARLFTLTLLHNPKRRQGPGINLAVETLGRQADVLVRCDAHAVYPPGYVTRLLATLDATGADAVVVPMDSVGLGGLQRAIAWVSDTRIGSGGSAHRGGRRSGWVDHGHHAAFRLDSFRRAGGYDESFTHNEDAELDCRQRAHGGRIWLDADIRIVYRPRDTLRGLATQYFAYGRGRSRTVRRHPGSMRPRQLAVPVHTVAVAASLAAAPAWPAALAWPALYAGVLGAQAAWLARRHRSWVALAAAPAAAVMHLAWGAGFLWGLLRHRETPWTPARAAAAPAPLRVRLADPSLFTGPYDAALDAGLQAAGVRTRWAVRPLRDGQEPDLPADRVDDFFYRRTDRLERLPGAVRTVLKGLAHLGGLARLAATARRERADVVHLQWPVLPLADAAAIAWMRRRCPVVLTVHDPVPYNGERVSWAQTHAFDLPLRMASHLVVHTPAGRDALVARGHAADKISVIPHGPLALRARPRPQPARDPRWTFVAFGEIKPYKGIDRLIEALGRLDPDLLAQCRVVVAGRPRMDTAPLHRRVAELGLQDTVEWVERRLTEQEMADLFAQADSFVFPYRQIDASGVYFLVKSLGKWLVASRLGVFAQGVRPGLDGVLVPPDDLRALSLALAAAVAQRPVAAARPDDDGWTAIGERTARLYARLVAAHGAAGAGAGAAAVPPPFADPSVR